jgi:formamidopyrimidine-DNA glycosylase
MPELPDITVYIDALEARVLQRRLTRIELRSPFVLRTVEPAPAAIENREVRTLRRIGKRIALGFDNDLWLVIHLMIAGRLQWADSPKPSRAKIILAVFHFDHGALTFTEAGSKKRASLHIVRGARALEELNPNGLEILECDLAQFADRLTSRNHTLKRALTDPRLFSGIGNAYSDEILHQARLSPIQLTQKLDASEIGRLFESCVSVLTDWTALLREQSGGEFPRKVTAFRPEMAVHGRYGKPCPVCETTVQRIRYADNELNYCPRCQTKGRVLADRSLSRLLKKDWPRTIEELETPKSSGS